MVENYAPNSKMGRALQAVADLRPDSQTKPLSESQKAWLRDNVKRGRLPIFADMEAQKTTRVIK